MANECTCGKHDNEGGQPMCAFCATWGPAEQTVFSNPVCEFCGAVKEDCTAHFCATRLTLNNDQAEAVIDAMTALNKVFASGGIAAFAGTNAKDDITVQWNEAHGVQIYKGAFAKCREHYNTQDDFAAAYKLN